jgi:hypothetical protein
VGGREGPRQGAGIGAAGDEAASRSKPGSSTIRASYHAALSNLVVHVWTTGSPLKRFTAAMRRSLSSCLHATRMWRRTGRASLQLIVRDDCHRVARLARARGDQWHRPSADPSPDRRWPRAGQLGGLSLSMVFDGITHAAQVAFGSGLLARRNSRTSATQLSEAS